MPRYSRISSEILETCRTDIIDTTAQTYRNAIFPRVQHLRGATRLNNALSQAAVRSHVNPSEHGYTTTVDGHRIELPAADRFLSAVFEQPVIDRFLAYADTGTTVFDVGANVGFYTVLAAKTGAEVHAFEMDPANYEGLRNVLTWNTVDAVINQTAVWREDGTVTAATGHGERTHVGDGDTTVSATTLDTYVAETGEPPGLIKLDVEGAEADVVAGATRILDRHQPTLLIECHDARLQGSVSVVETLERHGYTVERIGIRDSSAFYYATAEGEN
jgi:FkbM family methyltransferase